MPVTLNEHERTVFGSLLSRANSGDDPLSVQAVEGLRGLGVVGAFDKRYVFPPALERTRVFDEYVSRCLENTPRLRVLNLGAGFCTRAYRLNNGKCHWVDADTETIIDLRKEVLGAFSKRRHNFLYVDLEKSEIDYSDFDLIIAEGVLVYLREERARELVYGHMVFDVMDKRRKSLGADQKWIYDPDTPIWADLNILMQHEFDGAPGRGATILAVRQHELYHKEPEADSDVLGKSDT